MGNHYNRYLEDNVHAAIQALESERFYEFSEGLLELLNKAKHNDRLMWSLLATGSLEERENRLKEATESNDWY